MSAEAAGLRYLLDGPGELRSRVFAMYVQRRYEHERRKPHANPPYDLETMRRVLGQMAMGDALFVWRENRITLDQIQDALGIAPASFLEQAQRLHILVPYWGDWRFIHLLLRDYFAFEPLIVALKDTDAEVRGNAGEALGRIGDARAVKALIAALKDTYKIG